MALRCECTEDLEFALCLWKLMVLWFTISVVLLVYGRSCGIADKELEPIIMKNIEYNLLSLAYFNIIDSAIC